MHAERWVVHENDITSRTSLDDEIEHKYHVPSGIHDAGTKFLKCRPCVGTIPMGILVVQCIVVHLPLVAGFLSRRPSF